MEDTSGPPLGGGLTKSLDIFVPGALLDVSGFIIWAAAFGNWNRTDYHAVLTTVGSTPSLLLSVILLAWVTGAMWAVLMTEIETKWLDPRTARKLYSESREESEQLFEQHWKEYVHTLTYEHNSHVTRMVASFLFLWRSWIPFGFLSVSVAFASPLSTRLRWPIAVLLLFACVLSYISARNLHLSLASVRRRIVDKDYATNIRRRRPDFGQSSPAQKEAGDRQ